jgi:hypothetical protein
VPGEVPTLTLKDSCPRFNAQACARSIDELNHQDSVMTSHIPGGEPGPVAEARTTTSERGNLWPMRSWSARAPLNAATFTIRTETVMSEARNTGVLERDLRMLLSGAQ